jgi:hypothetical protein
MGMQNGIREGRGCHDRYATRDRNVAKKEQVMRIALAFSGHAAALQGGVENY